MGSNCIFWRKTVARNNTFKVAERQSDKGMKGRNCTWASLRLKEGLQAGVSKSQDIGPFNT